MALSQLSGLFVAFSLCCVTASALAEERFSVPFSTEYRRDCTHDTETIYAPDAAGVTLPPETESGRESYYAEPDPQGGYVLYWTSEFPTGEKNVVAHIHADGGVRSASLTGAGAEDMVAEAMGPVDLNLVGEAIALDISERVLIGRTFTLGEQFYPGDVGDRVFRQYILNSGMPKMHKLEVSTDLPFVGVRTLDDGARVLEWVGVQRMSVAAEHQGAVGEMTIARSIRIEVDATTGLLRSWIADEDYVGVRNGVEVSRFRQIFRDECVSSRQTAAAAPN